MNHLETTKKATPVNIRPLFSSAWLALFNELRLHYHERQAAVPTASESLDKTGKEQSGLKLN